MLPSMPILFSRDSQEAFGSRLQPGTSFFSQNFGSKQVIPEVAAEAPPVVPKQPEAKNKTDPEKKKKNDPPNVDDNALENAFVRSYYHRVQSRFSSNQSVPTNKFAQFRNILRDFNPNTESPSQLYKKIEDLFGEEHKDIVEDFLLFLKPEQALEVGRFMDRFQLAQMTSFLNMLHTTFARKPTVLRKVMRALTTALNSGTSEEMKARVLPHFRSNPRLTRVFKSLFPDERPADSLYESGVDMANESFLTADKGYDVWEFDDDTETKKRKTKEGLDTLYMNGRVFLQHGRLLRSARVTFPYSKEPYRVHARRLAPSHEPSPPHSDDETPPKEITKKIPPKRPRKQTKSPTKKDVNDNTKNNCQLSPKPKKSQKTKNGKKELDGNAPKRKDKQSAKKEDIPKPKHAKIEAESKTDIEARIELPIKVETKTEATIKIEPKTTITSIKVEPKPVASIKVEPKTVASIKVEPKTVASIKIEPKTVASIKVGPKVVAPIKQKIVFVNAEAKVETMNVRTGIAPVCVETKKIEEKSNNWTRDEDKTMLQVLKGEAGSEKVFGKIRELLPHRSATEIKERFCHVMTLLQQMGEVT